MLLCVYTVEPLLKDTPNKGHNTFDLSKKDWSLQDHGYTILPLKDDNLSITVNLCQKLLVPKCPLFRGSTVHANVYIFTHDVCS